MTEVVNPVSARYIELTARFKASWTFHRFLDGLKKFYGRQDLTAEILDFQSLYKRIREVSVLMNAASSKRVAGELDAISELLDGAMRTLDELDRQVAPSLLRKFFQKIQTYDERILIEMVRFYQESQRGRSWEPDRMDKVDYLVSRLAEVISGPDNRGDATRLDRVLSRLSENMRLAGVDGQRVDNRAKLISSVRTQLRDTESFDQLTESDLVGHYRSLKHALGPLYFERRVLPLIVATNLELGSRVNELAQLEEERVFADYENVSRLEQGGRFGRQLVEAVNRLHEQVGRFRRRLRNGDYRLTDLAELRGNLEAIRGRLGREPVPGDVHPGDESSSAGASPGGLAPSDFLTSFVTRELLGPTLTELIDSLQALDLEGDDSADSLEVLEFRLEPREIKAFRRLANGEECDDRVERFLLTAAALRRRMNQEVDELHALMSLSPSDHTSAASANRATLDLGDLLSRQFSHFVEGALVDGDLDEAQALQRCRMHLLRDYSGLWLLNDRVGET